MTSKRPCIKVTLQLIAAGLLTWSLGAGALAEEAPDIIYDQLQKVKQGIEKKKDKITKLSKEADRLRKEFENYKYVANKNNEILANLKEDSRKKQGFTLPTDGTRLK